MSDIKTILGNPDNKWTTILGNSVDGLIEKYPESKAALNEFKGCLQKEDPTPDNGKLDVVEESYDKCHEQLDFSSKQAKPASISTLKSFRDFIESKTQELVAAETAQTSKIAKIKLEISELKQAQKTKAYEDQLNELITKLNEAEDAFKQIRNDAITAFKKTHPEFKAELTDLDQCLDSTGGNTPTTKENIDACIETTICDSLMGPATEIQGLDTAKALMDHSIHTAERKLEDRDGYFWNDPSPFKKNNFWEDFQWSHLELKFGDRDRFTDPIAARCLEQRQIAASTGLDKKELEELKSHTESKIDLAEERMDNVHEWFDGVNLSWIIKELMIYGRGSLLAAAMPPYFDGEFLPTDGTFSLTAKYLKKFQINERRWFLGALQGINALYPLKTLDLGKFNAEFASGTIWFANFLVGSTVSLNDVDKASLHLLFDANEDPISISEKLEIQGAKRLLLGVDLPKELFFAQRGLNLFDAVSTSVQGTEAKTRADRRQKRCKTGPSNEPDNIQINNMPAVKEWLTCMEDDNAQTCLDRPIDPNEKRAYKEKGRIPDWVVDKAVDQFEDKEIANCSETQSFVNFGPDLAVRKYDLALAGLAFEDTVEWINYCDGNLLCGLLSIPTVVGAPLLGQAIADEPGSTKWHVTESILHGGAGSLLGIMSLDLSQNGNPYDPHTGRRLMQNYQNVILADKETDLLAVNSMQGSDSPLNANVGWIHTGITGFTNFGEGWDEASYILDRSDNVTFGNWPFFQRALVLGLRATELGIDLYGTFESRHDEARGDLLLHKGVKWGMYGAGWLAYVLMGGRDYIRDPGLKIGGPNGTPGLTYKTTF